MMKRKMLAAAMLLLMMSLMLCGEALAAQKPAEVRQEVGILLSGSIPSSRETFTVVMKALGDDHPMPAGQTGGEYKIKIEGKGRENTGFFPTITFNRVGVYRYKIWQEPGRRGNGTYDDTVYTMTVQITNSGDLSELMATITFRDDEGGPKPDNNLFHNTYASVDGTITPTGVADDWPYYLAGSAVLLMMSVFLMTKLRRREELEADTGVASMGGDEING